MAGGTGVAQNISPGQSMPGMAPISAIARPGDFAYDPQAQKTGVLPGMQPTVGNFPINLPPNMQGQSFSYGPDIVSNSQLMQAPMQPGQPDPVNGVMPMAPMSGKGGAGGQPAMPTARPPQGQYAPMAPQGQFNVNQASAGALQQAMQGTQAGMGFQAQNVQPTGYQAQAAQSTGYRPSSMGSQGYNVARTGSTGFDAANVGSRGYGASTIGQTPTVSAQNVQAGQLAGSDLGAYTNPYEDQVVQRTLSDLNAAQEKSLNQMGAQATAAKAFGGSRQGIAEAETRKGFAEQAAQAVSGLRQAGFTQAQQMAQQDIGTAQQAALANQQANLQAGTTTAGFSQQTNLSNQAAINAASQFGSGAANQAASQAAAQRQAASQFGASAANQAAMQNQAAINAASQFGSGAANQAAAANMAAQNQAAQFGSSAANQMALANQGAFNQAGQFGATQGMSAQLANQQAQMQANNARMAAAAQMAGLGQQAFGVGQTIQGNQQQQGLLQQSIQQALIDAARQQYGGYTGAPQTALQAPLAALGVTPTPQTTTNSMQPGLFNYLQLGAGMVGGSI